MHNVHRTAKRSQVPSGNHTVLPVLSHVTGYVPSKWATIQSVTGLLARQTSDCQRCAMHDSCPMLAGVQAITYNHLLVQHTTRRFFNSHRVSRVFTATAKHVRLQMVHASGNNVLSFPCQASWFTDNASGNPPTRMQGSKGIAVLLTY